MEDVDDDELHCANKQLSMTHRKQSLEQIVGYNNQQTPLVANRMLSIQSSGSSKKLVCERYASITAMQHQQHHEQ